MAVTAFFHGAVGGHDDHRQVRIEPAQLIQQLDAAHPGHLHVGEDQVQVGGAGDFQGFQGAGSREHFIAGGAQQGLHDGEIIAFVINNQDGIHKGFDPFSLSAQDYAGARSNG
jgi:hypothetical protein